MRWIALFALPVVVLAALTACGTETGNPEATVELEYNARFTDPSVAEGVDAVWLRIDPVGFASACGGEPDAIAPALGWADHAGVDAAVQTVELPDSSFCTVTTAFVSDAGATGEPPELAGASVAITGTLGDGRAFRVVLRDEVPIELTLPDEEVPDTGAWLLSFDVATWLDLAALDALADDPVVVDDATHPDLLDEVRVRLAAGVQLHHDADRDGQADDGERRLDAP